MTVRPDAPPSSAGYCAIDFGTSNSAIAVPRRGALPDDPDALALVPLEPEAGPRGVTMPTAVFYLAEGPDLHRLPRLLGRAAIQSYVEGTEGRLLRSMKSVLGSAVMGQHTDIGAGRSVSFADVISGYLRHLRLAAEAHTGGAVTRAVLGRPVFFVDGDAERDAAAARALEDAARAAGFTDLAFEYEPIAAAWHHEARISREQCVMVCDIGGGTSDFSVVRVGPGRRARADRRDDVLASHGVHVAGTDFDRRIELAHLMPPLGFGALGPARAGRAPREVPSAVYHDLATWHLINTVYRPQRIAELAAMKDDYADPAQHRRLMTVVRERLGHMLAGQAEDAKIAVAAGGSTTVAMPLVERGLSVEVHADQALGALATDLARIVAAAQETARLAGLAPAVIDALYFTGGSTGLAPLVDALCAAFPAAERVQGDRLASVATGLGLAAQRRFAS